ncbi:MAG: RNA ligase family protein [Desulfobulbaceae bacterium]|nr:RNA ligase family protein [Desulfobulbaceae bacterium]
MNNFFRFPHTPHLIWLGRGTPRDDKVCSPVEAADFLAGEVVVEEKLDGANLGISVSPEGEMRVQNRGQYLAAHHTGQFKKLDVWLALHADALFDALGEDLIMFGEWCAARHSLDYNKLPDWFLVFDVYDRRSRRFWSTARRDILAKHLGLAVVPGLLHGTFSLATIKDFMFKQESAFRTGVLEGIIVRRETGDWLVARAKLVRPDFTQAIGEHWQRRAIQWNRLDSDWSINGKRNNYQVVNREET